MGSHWNGTKLSFRSFKNRADFIQQGKDANAYNKNNISDPSRYDGGGKFSYLARYENKLQYESPDSLKDAIESFDNIISKIDMGGVFKKARLKVTDDKRGIFDFGLAAKGLYRRQEYFSLELAQDSPDEFAGAEYNFKPSGVVPFDFVVEDFVGEEKFYWYTAPNGKKYQLKKQQEGTRAVELKLPNARLVYATKTKKAYVMPEKKGGKAKMVELFIPVNKGIRLSTVLPLFLAARFFQLYGVMTRISVIRMYDGYNEYTAWGYPIKDYGDEMDFNFMALNGVDTRWWYAIRAVVVAIKDKESIDEAKKSTGKSKVSRIDFTEEGGSGGLPSDKKAYVELFSRYRNWYGEEIEKGNLPPLRTDKKLLISGVDERYYGRSSFSTQQIVNMFYRILDTVDFQFNSAEEACKRIYKRVVQDKLDEEYINNIQYLPTQKDKDYELKNLRITLTAEFKTYVQSVLFDTYDYPEGGMYPEPAESAKKLDEELDEKLEKLKQFIESL